MKEIISGGMASRDLKESDVLSISESFCIIVSQICETVRLVLKFDGIVDWMAEEHRLEISDGKLCGDVFNPVAKSLVKVVEVEVGVSVLVEDLGIMIVIGDIGMGKCELFVLEQEPSVFFAGERHSSVEGGGASVGAVVCV